MQSKYDITTIDELLNKLHSQQPRFNDGKTFIDLQHKLIEALIRGNEKEISEKLREATENALKQQPNSPETLQMLRFAAHFSLFFNLKEDELLLKYIWHNLIELPHYDKIAPYVSCLDSTDRVKTYASFVHSVISSKPWISQGEKERRGIMKLICETAERCDIHFSGVVDEVVKILEKEDADASRMSGKDVCQHDVVTLLDVLYMCSFDSTNSVETLKLANTFVRDIILRGDLEAGVKDAALLLDPEGVINVSLLRDVQQQFPTDDEMEDDDKEGWSEAEDAVQEFVCMMGFIKVELEYAQYVQGLISSLEMSKDLMHVLGVQKGFLKPPTAPSKRRDQLEFLRKKLVPRMTKRLMNIWKDHCEINQKCELLQLLCSKVTDLKSCFDYDPTAQFLDDYVDITLSCLSPSSSSSAEAGTSMVF